jgi:NitT/TauT family transport system substrate-binding protein
MKKFIVALLSIAVTIVIILLLIPKEDTKHDLLKIGYAPIADAAQIYVGIEKGFFEQENIKVEFVQLGSGPKILEAVSSGSVQIGLSSYVPFIFANNAGLNLKAITGGAVEDTNHIEHSYLVKTDSKIKTIKDLEGKRVAINGLKNIDHLIFQEIIEKYNLDLGKIRLVEIPFPQMESVLLSGEVDMIAAIEPFVTRAIQRKSARILLNNYVDLYPYVPVAGYVAQNSWLEKNVDLIKRFKNAFDKATDYCLQNPDSTRVIVGKYAKLNTEELFNVGLPTFTKNINAVDLQKLVDRMKVRKLIDKELDANQLIFNYE